MSEITAVMTIAAESPNSIRLASTDEAALAVDLWRGVATWLEDIGRPLWSSGQFDENRVRQQAASGQLALGFEGENAAACLLIEPEDLTTWPEAASGTALYLHKLATHRGYAGRGWGRRMIEWAARQANSEGIAALRLDCDPRPEFMRFYEAFGFMAVDGSPVKRGGYSWMRYERPLSTP